MMPYRVLVADPPWLFGDKLPGIGRGASKHYGCMSIEDICRFPIPAMANDSILFMWRVASMVPEAYEVVKRWGFVSKSELVWRKLTVTGNKMHFGMGRYTRASHECCIIATRGRATTLIKDKAVRSVFDAPTREHSEKPEAFYSLVERLVDGPYCELFARRKRIGWDCFGNEVPE